jgi:uncharacterized protein (UPF0218 family)
VTHFKNTLYLTKELRIKLKKPSGLLIKDADVESLVKIIEDEKPKKLVSVGDVTSGTLKKLGITANMYVIDNKVARKRIKPIDVSAKKVYKVKNQAGTLSEEAQKTIAEAMNHDSTKIIADIDFIKGRYGVFVTKINGVGQDPNTYWLWYSWNSTTTSWEYGSVASDIINMYIG